MVELEKRKTPSRAMVWLAPVLAVLLTMAVGAVVFTLLGYDGVGAVREIFVEPLVDFSAGPISGSRPRRSS